MTSENQSEQGCSACDGKKKGKLQRIIEGWGNKLFPNEEVEKLAKYRALRCATCDFNTLEVCGKCACPIPLKTRSTEEACPIGRW